MISTLKYIDNTNCGYTGSWEKKVLMMAWQIQDEMLEEPSEKKIKYGKWIKSKPRRLSVIGIMGKYILGLPFSL